MEIPKEKGYRRIPAGYTPLQMEPLRKFASSVEVHEYFNNRQALSGFRSTYRGARLEIYCVRRGCRYKVLAIDWSNGGGHDWRFYQKEDGKAEHLNHKHQTRRNGKSRLK